MGHVRLGRLPMTYRWQQVMDLLTTVPDDMPGISAAVLDAAENRLRELASDPSLTYSFWLLTRIARASYGDDFTTRLAELGVPVSADTSVISWNNDSLIESISELLRVSQSHEDRIAELERGIQTLEVQIGQLSPNWQRDIAEAKEQILTAGGLGVVFLLVGIASTLAGSIIGIVSG